MLKLIPGTDFMFMCTFMLFYGQEPGSYERAKFFKGQLENLITRVRPCPALLGWPIGAALQPDLGPWESGGNACYPSHKFIITKPHHPEDVICRFDIVKGTSVYYCDPFSEESRTQHSRSWSGDAWQAPFA
jgi:hypothetical protein